MELEHGLLLYHHPGNPRIGQGEQKEQPDDGAGTEVEELDPEGEAQEDAGREDVDRPFETHVNAACSSCLYLRCFIHKYSQSCCGG